MARLGKLADRLGELSQVPSRVARPVAARIDEEIRKEFRQGSNPYGVPWKDLADSTVAKKQGNDLILIEEGTLEQVTHARAKAGAGISLVSNEIGGYHQRGHATPTKLPKRAIFPDRSSLPVAWQKAIQEETDKGFDRVMKK